MYFNVQSDTGSLIIGYVIPDSFSAVAKIRASEGGKELLVFQTDEIRPDIRQAGAHETGMCGFTLDTSKIPGLENYQFLELHDIDSGLAIYRRRPKEILTEETIFRLETRLLSLWRLDNIAEPHFQAYYRNIERLGVNSATQLFQLHNVNSSYISGRVNIKPFEFFMKDKFKIVALYRRPYLELAERIMVLKQLAITGSDALGLRETMLLGPAISFFSDVDILNSKELRAAMRNLDIRSAAILANPYLKSLIADAPDSTAFDTNVAAGLDILASFSLVGIEDKLDVFLEGMSALTRAPMTSFVMPSASQKLVELEKELETMPVCGLLIDQDIEIYSTLVAAFEKTSGSDMDTEEEIVDLP